MRDYKHLSRFERTEPTIGKVASGTKEVEHTNVKNLRPAKEIKKVVDSKQKNRDADAKSSRITRDVLMDDLADRVERKEKPESVQRKAKIERAYVSDTRNPRKVRDAQVRQDSQGKVSRSSGVMVGRWIQIVAWAKKIAVVAITVLALWGGYKAIGPLAELFQRPIKSVTVEGEFHFISQDRATQLIMQEINDDFLQIDLSKIKSVLLADPWVETVTLTRRWPDMLVVKILEQTPIARWGEGFLNQRGQIVRVKEMKGLNDLPWLQGDEIYAAEILQQYQDLSLLLRSHGLEIIALKCDSKKSWRLTLKGNVEIAIGRDQVMEKMRRFVTVYKAQLQPIWSEVKSIDVRYSNGVAVRWIEGSDMAKKMIKSESSK